MLFLAALVLAQSPYDPEIEALMRHRDEKRAQAAQAQLRVQEPSPQRQAAEELAAVLPSPIARRLSACLATAESDAQAGLAEATKWATETDGGAYAAQCKGYALGVAGRWAEAAGAFESGASLARLDATGQARLWSQAGNAALAAGDVARAARDLDLALSAPLPAVLSTGEIHLDRARARVATGNLKGARADLDQAVMLAAADPLSWLLSATLARRMKDLPLATAHIAEAAKRARDDAAVALEQGIIDALAGRDAAARADFQRAQEIAPKDSDYAKKASAYLAQLAEGAPAAPAGTGASAPQK